MPSYTDPEHRSTLSYDDEPEPDWETIGPLMERYHIWLEPFMKAISDPRYPQHRGENWVAFEPITKAYECHASPLVAVQALVQKLTKERR